MRWKELFEDVVDLDRLPWQMPDDLRDTIKSWSVKTKSPFSHSYYDCADGEKTWDHTPVGSHRISDHWDFKSRGAIHCPTDQKVGSGYWCLGRWDGERYVILRKERRLKIKDLPRDQLHRLNQPQRDQWFKSHPDEPPFLNRAARRAMQEGVFYRGDFTAPYAHQAVDLTVLKNPSRGEMKRLFTTARHDPYTAGGKELRGLLSDDLYVWDAGLASHDDIKKAFSVSGMHVYFYPDGMKMDDYLLRDPEMKADGITAVEASAAIARALGPVKAHNGQHGLMFISA